MSWRGKRLVLAVSGALVAAVLSGVPAVAAPAAPAAAKAKPPVNVPVQRAGTAPADRSDLTLGEPVRLTWPKATAARVHLGGLKAGEALAVAPSGAVVKAGGTSSDAKAAVVSVAPAPEPDLVKDGLDSGAVVPGLRNGPVTVPAPRDVDVQVLDRKSLAEAGGLGLGVRLTRSDGLSQSGAVQVTLDYSGFKYAYGGDLASRLRLVQLPACALSTPRAKGCSAHKPVFVKARNDVEAGTMTATVQADGDPAGHPMGELVPDSLGAAAKAASTSTGSVYAVASTSSSDAGDYRASTLSPSGSWNVSVGSGAFNYNLPIQVPKAPTGSTPGLSLSYNSQAVDSLTSAANTQASWAGLGWDLNVGYVERRYRGCSTDGLTGVGDLCWDSPNSSAEPDGAIYVINLNGVTSELVQDGTGTGSYHVKDDPGWRVQHLTGGHGADDEYWVVSQQDGMRYYFGWGRSERTDPDPNWDRYTHSVLTVPVVGNDPGEPCYSQRPEPCTQAWRWGLDRVVDPHEVENAYFYEKQQNHYRSWANADKARAYDAAGYLVRIEYGWASDIAGAQLPAKVELTHVGRCVDRMAEKDPLANDPDPCPALSLHPEAYPDVPTDLLCDGTAADDNCRSITGQTASPTFFTTDMLWDIKTFVRDDDSSTWDPAMQYQMKYGLPNPEGTIGKTLWLDYVERKGYGDGKDLTLPTINFNGEWRDNQLGDHVLNFRRVTQVHGDLGSFVDVDYLNYDADPNGCDIADPPSESSNTQDCFKQTWTPEGATSASSGWFKKYLVHKVSVDPGVGKGADDDGDPVMTTTYDYKGKPAWAFPNDPLTKDDDESWTDWRGYQQVEVFTGTKDNAASTYYWLYRGLDGDRTSKTDPSATRSVNVTDGDSGSADVPDRAWLNGKTLESSRRDGTGQSHERVWHTYWAHTTATYEGLPDARFVRDAKTTTDELTSSGWREHVVNDEYDDTDPVSTTYGLPLRTNDWGLVDTDDNRCTTYGRAYNTDYFPDSQVQRWMVLPDETRHYTADCAARGAANQDSYTVKLYDGATSVASDKPTDGNVTTDRSYTDATHYRDVTSTYDGGGRVRSTTDGIGSASSDPTVKANHTTTTTYTPATSWPTGGVKATTPDPDGSGPGTKMSTTTWSSRLWGTPYKILDANGVYTRVDYDSVGRVSKVWKPTEMAGYDAGTTPSMRFTYTISMGPNSEGVPNLVRSTDTPPRVLSESLQSGGTYLTSYAYADGLGRARETQSPAGTGTGRTVVSTRYDTSGNVTGTSAAFYNSGNAGTGMVYPTVDSLPSYTDLVIDYAGRTTQSRILVKGDAQIQGQSVTNYHGDYTTTVPAVGERTNTYTDVFGQTSKVVEFGPSTYTTNYEYDRSGHPTKITDAKGNVTTYTYNWLGERLTTTEPDTGATSSTYDGNGNLQSATDGGNVTVDYAYDNLNRPLTTSAGGTVLTARTYDTATLGAGKPATATSYSGGKAYTTTVDSYDARGRQTGVTVTIPDDGNGLAGSYSTTYGYDAADHRTSVGYARTAGLPTETVTTGYDDNGMPDTLTSGLATYVNATDYDAIGRLTGRTYGTTGSTGTTARRSYAYDDATNWVTNITTTTSSQTPSVQNDTYTRDAAGQITDVADNVTGQRECFTYDELNRLTRAWTTQAGGGCAGAFSPDLAGSLAPYQQDYTYDGIGNLQKVTDTTATGSTVRDYVYPGYSADQQSYTPGAARPHAVTGIKTSSGTETYDYYGAGQMKTRTVGGVTTSYQWDALHRLSKVTGPVNSSYVYDADGNILLRSNTSESVLYLSGQELHKRGTSGPAATRYYTAGDATVAMRVGDGTTNGSLTWLMSDGQASTQLMVLAATGVVTRRRYKPFGEQRSTGLPAATDRGFLGKPEDDSTGLSILGARMYDPGLHRFLSPDPLNAQYSPQDVNGYSYSANNPVNFSDPTGLTRCDVDPSFCHAHTPPPAPVYGTGHDAPNDMKNTGSWGSKSDDLGIKDRMNYARLGELVGWWYATLLTTAADMTQHYLGNSGDPYTLKQGDIKKLLSLDTGKQAITAALKELDSKMTSVPEGETVGVDSKWKDASVGFREDPDLYFAMRGYQFRITGTGHNEKAKGGDKAVIDYSVEFRKAYNFDYGERVGPYDFGDFARLHDVGIAREYVITGRSSAMTYETGGGLPAMESGRTDSIWHGPMR
ncbi:MULTISPECIES: RHS repeat-associated core domain-containing protein [unclassified Streptomyces]|uniref:RHS repeat domain-containing protein n=1 Tax=unclassified Streptomyces TaxID=2593676 RepID=UPI0038175A25